MRKVIIYNNHRPEKYDLFVAELERQKLYDWEIFHCEKNQKRVIVESISESFKSVIREAKEKGEKEIAIFEDDIMFPNVKGWDYFIKNKPDVFDIYIGGSYAIDNRIEYKAPITKVDWYVGNQLIIVNESYYDTWLNSDSTQHCDSVHKKGLFYLCWPMVALQRSGWSSNSQSVVNYNYILKEHPEYIY